MTTFLFYFSLTQVAYFVIGYVVSFIFILRDKAGGKIVRELLADAPDDEERYSATILLWPLLLFILACIAVKHAKEAIVKAFSRISLSPLAPLQPEALVNKIVDRNKMTTLIEGKDAEDG